MDINSASSANDLVLLLVMKLLDESSFSSIIDALLKLDLCDPDNINARNTFKDTNFCKNLVYVLGKTSDTEMQSKMCGLIASFTYEVDMNDQDEEDYFVRHFVAYGAGEAIINSMKKSADHERLQELGLSALANLSGGGGQVLKFNEVEGIVLEVVQRAMSTFPLNVDLQCDAVGCLYHIISQRENNRNTLMPIDKIIIKSTLDAMDTHLTCKYFIEYACFVLKKLVLMSKEANICIRLKGGAVILAKVECHFRIQSNNGIADIATTILKEIYQ